MFVTERPFDNTFALREMLKGFEMLFGSAPEVRIITRSAFGMPTGVRTRDGELLFGGSYGYLLKHIGTRYITVDTGAEGSVEIDTLDGVVTFIAVFYL